jgi:mRNA interferase MazF
MCPNRTPPARVPLAALSSRWQVVSLLGLKFGPLEVALASVVAELYRALHPRYNPKMGIQFPAGVGTILLCDYNRGGFQPPEMVKRRPAVVISPRLPFRDGLCTVVPISSDDGMVAAEYVVRLEFKPPLPAPFSYDVAWAKCDMLATVGFARLDFFHTERDQHGRRKYLNPKLPTADLERVRRGVLFALGMGKLTLTGK